MSFFPSHYLTFVSWVRIDLFWSLFNFYVCMLHSYRRYFYIQLIAVLFIAYTVFLQNFASLSYIQILHLWVELVELPEVKSELNEVCRHQPHVLNPFMMTQCPSASHPWMLTVVSTLIFVEIVVHLLPDSLIRMNLLMLLFFLYYVFRLQLYFGFLRRLSISTDLLFLAFMVTNVSLLLLIYFDLFLDFQSGH